MHAEIAHTIESLRDQLETLAVRGLRAAGPEHLAHLRAAHEEFERIGAAHLATRIAAVVHKVEQNDRGAAGALLAALTSLRLFDRVLTLEVAQNALPAFATEAAAEASDDPTGADEPAEPDDA